MVAGHNPCAKIRFTVLGLKPITTTGLKQTLHKLNDTHGRGIGSETVIWTSILMLWGRLQYIIVPVAKNRHSLHWSDFIYLYRYIYL